MQPNQKNTDPLTEELLSFVKEHLPATSFYKEFVSWRAEAFYSRLPQSELVQLIFIISQELRIYFTSISAPCLHKASNGADELASSIAVK